MYMAAHNGHVHIVKVLLKYNANLNQAATDDGDIPMYMAAQNGHTDVVKVLLENNAYSKQAATDDGTTPLHASAVDGNTRYIVCLKVQHASALPRQREESSVRYAGCWGSA